MSGLKLARGCYSAGDLPDVSKCFRGLKHPCRRSLVTLHGVVFDIFGWEREAGRAAVFPDDDRRMACPAVARACTSRETPLSMRQTNWGDKGAACVASVAGTPAATGLFGQRNDIERGAGNALRLAQFQQIFLCPAGACHDEANVRSVRGGFQKIRQITSQPLILKIYGGSVRQIDSESFYRHSRTTVQ